MNISTCCRTGEISRFLLHFVLEFYGCEFRYKLDSDSSRSWTPIPAQPGQPKVIT